MLWRSARCCPSSESRSHGLGLTRARGASAGLGSPSRRSSRARRHRPCSTLLLRHFVSDKTRMPTVRLYLMNDAARRLAGRSITHGASESAPCINFLACCFYRPLLQRDCSTGEFTQAEVTQGIVHRIILHLWCSSDMFCPLCMKYSALVIPENAVNSTLPSGLGEQHPNDAAMETVIVGGCERSNHLRLTLSVLNACRRGASLGFHPLSRTNTLSGTFAVCLVTFNSITTQKQT